MTEELNAKWRELLAANRTWWWPGMLVQDGDRYTEESRYPRSVRVPDWRDPATLGCLLAMVAEAHGVSIDDVHVLRTLEGMWSVWIFRTDGSSYLLRVATHLPNRAEALIAALEAAP